MAQSGNSYTLVTSENDFLTTWIIDSVTSDMTSSSKIFSTYSPCLGKQKIKVVDGSFSPIVWKGNVKISSILSLKLVLHIPNLSYNLLSIGKFTKDLNYFVLFISTGCIFQDFVTGKMIRHVELKDGLYYLEANLVNTNLRSQGFVYTTYQKRKDHVWLWHRCLGHALISMQKKSLPCLKKIM